VKRKTLEFLEYAITVDKKIREEAKSENNFDKISIDPQFNHLKRK